MLNSRRWKAYLNADGKLVRVAPEAEEAHLQAGIALDWTVEEIVAYGIPCKQCGNEAWILVDHPVTKLSVCLECKAVPPPGWVACPGDHKTACVLCRATPGYLEEV